MKNLINSCLINSCLPIPAPHRHESQIKGQRLYTYIALLEVQLAVLVCGMLYNYLPDRATPPILGVKIPGSCQHTHTGWHLTCLPASAMALLVLIYT